MARGASPAPNALPKASFVKVTDELTQQPQGVHDHIAKSYGYNDFNDEFVRPEEYYIRYIEPLESDLATQVEYDMDEQDQEWLDAVNQERKAQQLDKVSYETFEIVMDRLEKEWFDLSKNIPKSDMGLPSEDSTCAICDDSEGENTNAIVFCDGCNLAVHQDCYGVPYIPEGQWLCRKCTVSPENPVSCILCPNEGGAFKQTVSGEWVHLLCAIWVPETAVANDVFMEPITGVEKISKQRWKLRCSVCGIREGACIQCSKTSCFTAFHVTCARREKLLMPMKATQGSEAPTLAAYCERHLPREQREARAAALKAQRIDGSEGDDGQTNSKSNKTARAYAKTYKPGPPLVPRIIVNRILQYISRIPIRHKTDFVNMVCRYWSLKREARRGAPLLKRLHLEPWTALSGSKQQTDEEKVMKLELMRVLRLDLERVRLIIDVIRHRESTKQKQQEQIQLVLSRFFFPHEPALRFAFEKVISHDRQGYFKSPVNRNEVPDYYDIIKDPMCWDIIDSKLDSHEYLDVAEFKRDVELVVSNAMIYNQANTPFYKTAARVQSNLPNIFSDLDKALGLQLRPPKLEQTEGGQPASRTPPDNSRSPLGDLEPPLGLLEMLVSEELIRQDTNVVMMATPIESLLSYELPNIRPPAPPPPPLKSKPGQEGKEKQKKPKIDRKAALERKRQERLRALDSSPGFRAPRTRAAMAAAAAFEAEATGSEAHAESSSAAQGREGSAEATKAEKAAKKPRRSVAPPPQDLPLTVDDVDNRKSFTMFERGWILPPDQKRGGRPPIERQPLPPPKKKAKTSRRSVSSSALADRGSSFAADLDASPQPVHHVTVGDVQAIHNSALPRLAPSTPEPRVLRPTGVPEDIARTGAATPVSEALPATERLASETSITTQYHTPESAPAEGELMDVDSGTSASHAAGFLPASVEGKGQHIRNADRDRKERCAEAGEREPELERTREQAPRPAPEPDGDRAPPRVIIIEELDTPATRREKNMRKKMQRQEAREAAAREAAVRAAAAGTSRAPAPRRGHAAAGPSGLRDEEAGENDSDLTDLSDVEVHTEQAVDIPSSAGPGVLQTPSQGPVVVRSSRRQPPPRPPSPPEVEPGAISLEPGERLEGGTLVWAKIESFPWWPAVVFEEDDPEVPPSVLARAPPREPDLELVRFYEKKHINNWAWVRHKNMRYLGEDNWLDSQMLAPTSKYQRWRNTARRTECRNAYQDALAEMDIGPSAPQQEGSARPQTRSSRAGAQSGAGRTRRPDLNAQQTADLVPVAMGADSPMTDVDSY
ncbi:hypothetical protein BD414DRAFT_578477 [Trametes punicea]|nr:hypothetical protein BD414DRAFT_578477 [Trametes punicea]